VTSRAFHVDRFAPPPLTHVDAHWGLFQRFFIFLDLSRFAGLARRFLLAVPQLLNRFIGHGVYLLREETQWDKDITPVDLFMTKKVSLPEPPRPPFFNYARGHADNNRSVVKMRTIKGDSASTNEHENNSM